jgi:hypothetical protein
MVSRKYSHFSAQSLTGQVVLGSAVVLLPARINKPLKRKTSGYVFLRRPVS